MWLLSDSMNAKSRNELRDAKFPRGTVPEKPAGRSNCCGAGRTEQRELRQIPEKPTICTASLSRMFCFLIVVVLTIPSAAANPVDAVEPTVPARDDSLLNLREMLAAGGIIGYVIVGLSFVMVFLIVDHLINIRRSILMPPGLAEEVHRCLAEKQYEQGKKYCELHPGFLSRVLHSGLDEVGPGYSSIEKAMEDAAVEQSARLFRRIEYLSVISALAPMLGLMGTVWGMILAFLEFEQKANPQVSELAPGIYRALITTLLGLGVAIPALAAFSLFRNRIDELAAEATLLAEHVFADHRRAQQSRRTIRPQGSSGETSSTT